MRPSDVFHRCLFRELYYYVSTDGGKLDCSDACRALPINPLTNQAASQLQTHRLTETRRTQTDFLACNGTKISQTSITKTYQTNASQLPWEHLVL